MHANRGGYLSAGGIWLPTFVRNGIGNGNGNGLSIQQDISIVLPLFILSVYMQRTGRDLSSSTVAKFYCKLVLPTPRTRLVSPRP